MQPQLTSLPYYPDAILDYFAPLSSKPWAMLLHSGNSSHHNSRYDILVAAPVVTMVTCNGVTKINHGANIEISYDDPFTLVQQQLLAAGLTSISNTSLPFLGGALGYFGYDLIRSIETLPRLAQNDIPLPEMAIGIYRWTLISDNYQHKLTLVTYDDPAPLLAQLNDISLPIFRPFRLLGPWHSNMTRAEYGDKFRQVQQHLLAGDCYQVCLAQRFSVPYSGDEWPVFLHLLNYNRAPFSAFIRLENQIVMSLSPERFLSLRDGKIQSCPIKGTLPRLADIDADRYQIEQLAVSAKDQAENLMIVDLLRNDIGRVALPGSVRVPSLFAIETFTAVHHMVSTITATIKDKYTPCDLLRACFPGGSVTGAPKIQAMKIIEKLEPQRRSVWCGNIGYISCCDTMDTNIAIRSLLVVNQHIYCAFGGGIIADSDEEMEYQEMIAKSASLLPFLEKLTS